MAPSLCRPRLRRRQLLPLVLALVLLTTTTTTTTTSFLAAAHPTTTTTTTTTPLLHARQDPPSSSSSSSSLAEADSSAAKCGFEGDQDTYGLGIRIGLYLQWITSSLAYNFVPDEAVTMRGVNNCFQAAMFAGLLFVTVTRGAELYAVEAYMMLLFCMGGVCSGTAEDGGGAPVRIGRETTMTTTTTHHHHHHHHRAGGGAGGGQGAHEEEENEPAQQTQPTQAKPYAFLQASSLGGYIRLLLGCGFVAYGLWFVFAGMDGMRHPPCSRHAFFFARVDLYGWFRGLLKALFVLSAVPAGLQLVSASWSLAGELRRLADGVQRWRRGAAHMTPEEVAAAERERRFHEEWARTDPAGRWRKGGGRGMLSMGQNKKQQQQQQDDDDGEVIHMSSAAPTRNDTATTLAADPKTTTTTTTATASSAAAGTDTKGPLDPSATAYSPPTSSSSSSSPSPNPQQPPRRTPTSLVLNNPASKSNKGLGGALIVFIIATELTIKWNHISDVGDVGSTGQLLPLIIGVGGVGRVLYALFRLHFNITL